MNKSHLRLLAAGVFCLLAAAAALLAGLGWYDSINAYRSPLSQQPPAPGPAVGEAPEGAPGGVLGEALTGRLVIVLVDGLRLDTAQDAAQMPFLNEISRQGVFAAMRSRAPSYSQAGYSVLFTGAWPELTDGPAFNVDFEQIPTWTQDNLFSAAARSGLSVGISGYNWFEKLVPQADVSASFYTPGEDQQADRQVVDAALPWLQSGRQQLILIHLDQVDYAGHHEGGPADARWAAAARRTDDLIAAVAGQLDLQRDTLLVTSDHGHISSGGHGGHDADVLREPFILVGAGVRPGADVEVQMADVAPTAAVLLGLNLPASSQGRPLVELLDLDEGQLAGVQAALSAQQAGLAGAYLSAIGRPQDPLPIPAPAGDPLEHYTSLMQQARTQRLNAERLPRALLALATLAAAGVLLWMGRGRRLLWLFAGALVYFTAFYLLYAVLLGRAYSFSAILSQNDLLLTTAAVAVLSLAAGGLFVLAATGSPRQGSLQVAGDILDLAVLVIVLLALPAGLLFVLSGARLTWTLPDLRLGFLGFFSLLQILFAGLGGVLLAGLTTSIIALQKRIQHGIQLRRMPGAAH